MLNAQRSTQLLSLALNELGEVWHGRPAHAGDGRHGRDARATGEGEPAGKNARGKNNAEHPFTRDSGLLITLCRRREAVNQAAGRVRK